MTVPSPAPTPFSPPLEHCRECEGDSRLPTPGSHTASPRRVLYSEGTATIINQSIKDHHQNCLWRETHPHELLHIHKEGEKELGPARSQQAKPQRCREQEHPVHAAAALRVSVRTADPSPHCRAEQPTPLSGRFMRL